MKAKYLMAWLENTTEFEINGWMDWAKTCGFKIRVENQNDMETEVAITFEFKAYSLAEAKRIAFETAEEQENCEVFSVRKNGKVVFTEEDYDEV